MMKNQDDLQIKKNTRKYIKKNGSSKIILKEKNQKGKKTEKGKPKGLANISINQPNFWATDKTNLEFINLCLTEGRHINLHLAGTTHIAESNKKEEKLNKIKDLQQQIKIQKPLFNFIEDFGKKYFQRDCGTRSLVFFFRNNQEYEPKYVTKFPIYIEEWKQKLEKMHFLLDERFYEELQFILFSLEQNFDPTLIADKLIDQSTSMSEAPQMMQNLMIQLFLDGSIYYDQLNDCTDEQIEEIFQNSIRQYKLKVVNFIIKIKEIFYKLTQMQYEQQAPESINQEISQSQYHNDNPEEMYFSD